MYGRLDLDNSVPGELGHGLEQEYDGDLLVLTVANGMTFRWQDGWSLTPQLQLAHARIDQDDFSDDLGARIRLHQGDSWVGRLGLEVGKTLASTSWLPAHC
jgi:fibronectin-binding autotransporter adhesin